MVTLIMPSPFHTRLLIVLLLYVGVLSAQAQTDGSIPNVPRPASELYQFISPTFSARHLNQPSVFNGYLVLGGNAEHEVWDISDPTSPVLRGEMLSNHADGEAESHQVTYGRDQDGNYYMATLSGRGIDIWNMNVTTSPTLTGEVLLPGINYGDVAGGVWGVSWQGDYVYVGATDNGVYVVDVSDPASPQHVATLPREEMGGVSAGPVFALGDLLVVVNPKGRNGVATVDISSPTSPRLLDSISPSRGGYIGGFYGVHAHVEPFLSLDVTTDPRNITENPFTVDFTPSSEYISFSDDFLYLGGLRNSSSGIWKYDISDVENPVLVGRVVGRRPDIDDQFSVPIGNLVMVAEDSRKEGVFVGGALAVHAEDADTTPPSIKWLSIPDGETEASRSGQIGLSFSEWIEFKSVDEQSLILRPVGGQPVSGQWGCTYTLLTFASDEPLLANTTYELVLPAGGVSDLVGNTLPADIVTTFTTGRDLPASTSIIDIDPSLITELGETTTFEVNSPDPNLTYEWEFGDGSIGTGAVVNHNYTSPGRYNVQYIIRENPVQTFEAEEADLAGVLPLSTNTNFSGNGYADFGGGQTSDTRVLWTVQVPAAVTTDLTFRYASSTDRPLNLVVNGGSNILLPFTATGNFSTWEEEVAPAITLNPGMNTIELRADAGSVGPNIDYLRALLINTDTTVSRLEAEAATQAGTNIRDSVAGASEGLYSDYTNTQGSNAFIRWEVDLPYPITTDLSFRYGSSSNRPLNLIINGGAPTTLDFNSTGSFGNWQFQEASGVSLNAGMNTIELQASAGSRGGNIDYLEFEIPPAPINTEVLDSSSFVHIVHRPLTDNAPTRSAPLVIDNGLIWAVNADADTVSGVDAETLTRVHEIPVGEEPKALARANDGLLWVVSREDASLSLIDPVAASVVDRISLPPSSQPVGVAISPDGSSAYVTLSALGQLVKINTSTQSVTQTLDLGPDSCGHIPNVRGIAVSSDSSTIYVTRFISPDTEGEVYQINAADLSLAQTIPLAISGGVDTSQFSRGLPNYLTSITISPDGVRAWVPSKKDNIQRGGQRDGLPLEHDVTVRALTSSIDLITGAEVASERVDHDNADRCHDASFSPLGDLVFISMPGNQQVRVLDAYNGNNINAIDTQEVPEGSVIDPSTGTLYVLNFLSRSLSAYDVSDMLNGGSTSELIGHVDLVSVEPLSAEVLRGKKLFYDATSENLNQNGYMSCASCHLDGSHDGRTYDFSAPQGEGFRNTIDLRGRSGTGHGRVHWTGNFDEIHDFEGQIRDLGAGEGLMNDSDFLGGSRSTSLGDPKGGISSDLDALSAYVASLDEIPESPYRQANGSLTSDALLGKAHFERLACASCHSGPDFTDSPLGNLHNVGTIKVTSGSRLSEALTGLDTPTLKGLWDTAPYLHDGSAKTLRDVLTTSNPADEHGAVSTLNDTEIDQLVTYLLQIDDREPESAPLINSGSTAYQDYITSHGLSGNAALSGADPDGDGWTNAQEFALGATDPTSVSLIPEPICEIITEGGEEYLQLSYLRREGGVWDGNTYVWGGISTQAQGSSNLSTWDLDLETFSNGVNLPASAAGYIWTTGRISTPISAEDKGFLRLGVDSK